MTDNPRAVMGGNLPPHLAAFQVIDDLFDEAKNFADGHPIDSEELHDAITSLRTQLHEAGKVAEALRVEAKKPHDDAIAEIQNTYNKYVQAKRGKVDIGKKALDDLLGAWRIAKQEAARIEAARIAAIAAAEREAAQAAMAASYGNLEARVEAEQHVEQAKAWEKAAKRADKAAETGTGLVTVWVAVMDDESAAMEWCWARAKSELLAVAQQNADEVVRSGVRAVPGFVVKEEKRAR